jgi:hypothetical protein
MSKQDLDHPNINILFEQVGRKAMAQSVRRHPLGKLGYVSGSLAGARQLARRHRVDGVLAREQPALRPCNAIPVAQKFEQHGGKHRIAIFATLALLDAQHHTFGVDVRDLQRHHLGNT